MPKEKEHRGRGGGCRAPLGVVGRGVIQTWIRSGTSAATLTEGWLQRPMEADCGLLCGKANTSSARLVIPKILLHGILNLQCVFSVSKMPCSAHKQTLSIKVARRFQAISFSFEIIPQSKISTRRR